MLEICFLTLRRPCWDAPGVNKKDEEFKIMRNPIEIAILLLFLLPLNVLAQQKVKILSYNVLYGLKKDSVNIERYKKLIAKLNPDIVATQEMNGFTQKSLESLANSYGHPYALQSKEEGFPTALTSKKPMVNAKKVTENMWHSYIYSKVDGLHIFVIHFSPFSYKKRLEEVRNIIAQTNEIPADEPILIMGDFNSLSPEDKSNYNDKLVASMHLSEEKHDHIRNLNNGQIDYTVIGALLKAGFKDTFYLKENAFEGTAPTFKDGSGKIKQSNAGTPKRIDYIFCNDVAAKSITVSKVIKDDLTHFISDHYPMYIELER